MKLIPDQIIDKRYKVIKRLGQGGMGEVWKALDQQAGGDVVIKMPLEGSNHTVLDRFANEAKMMREHSMGNPNILDIQGMGNIDSIPYYVMRYLAGGSLEDRRPIVDEQGQPDFRPESYEWLMTIAKALDFLHSKNVLHRDVKPGNIMFNESGDAYLVDFGIVKTPLEASSFTSAPTAANSSPGTVEYMPPEVLAGQIETLSGLGDQYALAVTLYEMIAGRRPFTGPTETAIYHAIERGPTPLTEIKTGIPQSASAVVTRVLRSDPERRFKTCREFALAFLSALEERGGPVGPGGPGAGESGGSLFDDNRGRVIPKKPEGKTGRKRLTFWLTGTVVFLVGLGAFFALAVYPKIKLAANQTESLNNLRQLGLAAHNYQAAHERYPAQGFSNFRDLDDRVIGAELFLSWRTTVLPFLELSSLADSIDTTKPWDSVENRPFIKDIPYGYVSPFASELRAGGKTVYVALSSSQEEGGRSTVFPKPQEFDNRGRIGSGDISDGTSNTILFVEANKSAAVEWTRPRDIDFDLKNPKRHLGGLVPSGVINTVFADGSTHALSPDTSPEVLKSLALMNDGEVVEREDF